VDELKSMRAFVKVVETGSFAEAARQTHTSKSVMTKRVNQLEDHLQLELMQRSTRKLTITDTGAAFYERCVDLLAELDEAKSAVSSIEWGLTGTFRVSCISSLTASYMADDICEFQQDHPDLRIELLQHDRFCDPVQEGFDVCLQLAQSPKREIIERVDLIPTRRLVVATPEYLEKHGRPKKPQDIKSHRFAHNIYVQPDCRFDFIRGKVVVSVAFNPVITTNTIWLLRSALLHDECMAMMPVFFIEKELISGKFVPVLPEYRLSSFHISAFYRRTSYVPMKIRIFLNFLRGKYGDFPPWEKRVLNRHPEFSFALGRET
jgi:DNA-binding transcriptional LysR family regulator